VSSIFLRIILVRQLSFPLSSLEGKSLDGVARILAPDGKLVNSAKKKTVRPQGRTVTVRG